MNVYQEVPYVEYFLKSKLYRLSGPIKWSAGLWRRSFFSGLRNSLSKKSEIKSTLDWSQKLCQKWFWIGNFTLGLVWAITRFQMSKWTLGRANITARHLLALCFNYLCFYADFKNKFANKKYLWNCGIKSNWV